MKTSKYYSNRIAECNRNIKKSIWVLIPLTVLLFILNGILETLLVYLLATPIFIVMYFIAKKYFYKL